MFLVVWDYPTTWKHLCSNGKKDLIVAIARAEGTVCGTEIEVANSSKRLQEAGEHDDMH